MNEPTPLTLLAKTLEDLPVYIVSFALSLLVAILSDVIITALTLGCVALGFIAGPLIAVAGFFFMYVSIRTVNSIANAIGHTGQGVIRTLTACTQPPPVPSPFPVPGAPPDS